MTRTQRRLPDAPGTMSARLRGLTDIAEAEDEMQAWERLERLRHGLGFEYMAFGAILTDEGSPRTRTDYRTGSVRQAIADYEDRGLDRTDPDLAALAEGASRVSPTHGDRVWSGQRVAAHGALLDLFRDYGISGHVALRLAMPMGAGAAFFGVGTYKPEADAEFRRRTAAEDSFIRLMATTFVAKLDRPARKTMAAVLSPAEAMVMRRLSQGLSPEEIAEAAGKALPTIRHQIYSAKRRLGARSVTQAVVMAERLGITD